jgi:hypothetical protein
MFTSITECVVQCGAQLAATPRSKLSRTGHNWATETTNVDLVNGVYPSMLGAVMWIHAGFLDPAYTEPGYDPAKLAQDTPDCFWIWQTCRRLYGLGDP